MNMNTKIDLYQDVTDRIIAGLEAGIAPWVRPWKSGGMGNVAMPHNAVTRRNYNGINVLLLAMQQFAKDYESAGWLTYNQARAAGGNVIRGESGTKIVFWSKVTKKDENNKEKAFFILKAFTVFNVAQCENIKIRTMPVPVAPTESELLEIISKTGAKISHGGDRACYSPVTDAIAMPMIGQFKSVDHYHGTLLHELCHWTGHKSRNDRDLSGRFGSESYAMEELIAELGSAFLCASLGIELAELQHKDYIGDWLKVLKSDKKAIFAAAKHATQAAEFIKDFCGLNESHDDEMEETEQAA